MKAIFKKFTRNNHSSTLNIYAWIDLDKTFFLLSYDSVAPLIRETIFTIILEDIKEMVIRKPLPLY